MTSDVIRRLYMSYNPLFHNCLHSHNFAKSEPIDGLEYLPTDSSTPLTSRSNPPEVDSLFKGATIHFKWIFCSNEQSKLCFCPTESILPDKNQLALSHGRGIFLRSRKSIKGNFSLFSMRFKYP